MSDKRKAKEKLMTGYPSIDKPWLKYYTEEALAMKAPECTVYRNIYDNNKDYPNDIALLYFGRRITYKKLFTEIEKCAKSLKQIGIKEDDCVTLCTAGVPEAIYIVLACSKIGALANFINPLFTTEQMIDRINDTGAEWIFILDKMYSYIEKALPDTCIKNIVIIPVYNSMPTPKKVLLSLRHKAIKAISAHTLTVWNDFVKLGDNYKGKTEAAYQNGTPVIMVYSSGTTGASKGIVLTNESVSASILDSSSEKFPYERGYKFLQMIPVWFSTGIVLSMLMPLTLGITVIPEPVFNVKSFIKDILEYKPQMTLVATSIWLSAIHDKDFQNSDLSGMRYPMTGGEKLIDSNENEINSFLMKHGCKTSILKGYGMCELGGKVSDSMVFRNGEKVGSVGIPMIGVTVSVFDIETNKEVKYGECGEIRVNSPGRMKEYYKNEAETAEFFHIDENGIIWGCTGDIGYIDEDGVIYVLGRATDCAALDSGKKVYLFGIENVIMQEGSLSGCKVVTTKENGKTELAAHMTLRSDNNTDKKALAYRIYENCKKNLSAEEIPTKYKFRDSFPVHSNGKRDNGALAAETEGFIRIE